MFRSTFTIFPSLYPNLGVSWENMGLEPPPPLICKKTMTKQQQPIKTHIYFSHFSDNFFHIFSYPNPNFGASWEQMGMNQRCFPFFTYLFSIFPIHISILRDLGKKWGWTPSFHIHYSHPQIQISTRFGKKWSWSPTGQISICDSLCAQHTPMGYDISIISITISIIYVALRF